MNPKYLRYKSGLILESGECLEDVTIAYHTYGEYSFEKNNVVWVCHALTANSDVFDWWAGLFGEEDFFNPNEYFIVCANILGSCYGSTGPLSVNNKTGQAYYHDFPQLTVRDLVAAHDLLRRELRIEKIHTLIGSSLGGMQALEWAYNLGEQLEHLIFIASNARHSSWGIAFNESQRMAIAVDPSWKKSSDIAGLEGLKAARSIALLSYRNYQIYQDTQMELDNEKQDGFKASLYQNYQGLKLSNRFNAYSYWQLTKIMDGHNIGRGRISPEKALSKISVKTLLVGVVSDLLFPTIEQQFLAQYMPCSKCVEINSLYGHDGFLLEQEQLTKVIKSFYK